MAQELKEHDLVEIQDYRGEVYLKSEADQVIAEKDEKIGELEERIDELQKAADSAWSKVNAMYDELRHHKYKRCLAMAEWCDEMMMSCELRGYSVHRIWANRHQWAMRWKYRWLELSEKFKEA